jgi:hypothetical protein
MKYEMARLNKKNFEMKKLAGGLVVVLSVVVGSQTAVDGLSSDPRCLAAGCWEQWVTTQRRQPSQNVRKVVKQVVAGVSGASWVFGMCFGGVLLGLAVYVVVLELPVVVLGRAEQGTWLSSSNTLTVTWQSRSVTRDAERGLTGQAGGSRMPWGWC